MSASNKPMPQCNVTMHDLNCAPSYFIVNQRVETQKLRTAKGMFHAQRRCRSAKAQDSVRRKLHKRKSYYSFQSSHSRWTSAAAVASSDMRLFRRRFRFGEPLTGFFFFSAGGEHAREANTCAKLLLVSSMWRSRDLIFQSTRHVCAALPSTGGSVNSTLLDTRNLSSSRAARRRGGFSPSATLFSNISCNARLHASMPQSCANQC